MRQSLLKLSFVIISAILLNIIGQYAYGRFDLTKEKRFTLTPPTQKLLTNLDDVVYVKVFLEGEFPAGFKRLRNSIQEMLDEFRSYSGNRVEYEFIDYTADTDVQEREAVAKSLMEKGLEPTRLIENKEDYSEKIIFPGAIITYKGRELPITLLQEQLNKTPEEALTNSTALLEFNLANTIQKLQRLQKPTVAFLDGHGELSLDDVQDFAYTLTKYYSLERFKLTEQLYIPQKYSAIVIAKPTLPFEESNKYKIDQYVMNGGKVLWLLENLNCNLDSLTANSGSFIALNYGLNLEDQLFRYGARVNFDVVQDMQCAQIPLATGIDQFGNAKQMELFPWNYYPVVTAHNDKHPLSKNTDALLFQFAGSIDTIAGKDSQVKKSILLTSSPYARRTEAPVKINVNQVRQKIDPAQFPDKNLPVAVALEGKFTSVFKNRLAYSTKQMTDTIEELKFKEQSAPTRMVVISDGDFARNDFDTKTGRAAPLGYYKYTRETFANKDFLMNTIEWLTDDYGIIAARNRDVKARLLDEPRVKTQKTMWQLFNILVPIGMAVVFGAGFSFWRKRKYATGA